MKKIYKLNDMDYELIENYKDCFNYQLVEEKATDYFNAFDYILGDYSYDKLRLKGFCNKDNKNFKSYNDFEKYKIYLKEECAYDCGYFILKKIS